MFSVVCYALWRKEELHSLSLISPLAGKWNHPDIAKLPCLKDLKNVRIYTTWFNPPPIPNLSPLFNFCFFFSLGGRGRRRGHVLLVGSHCPACICFCSVGYQKVAEEKNFVIFLVVCCFGVVWSLWGLRRTLSELSCCKYVQSLHTVCKFWCQNLPITWGCIVWKWLCLWIWWSSCWLPNVARDYGI